jgi:type IV pilus assembly protein PilW
MARDARGFTLVEVVLALSIGMLIVGGGYAVLQGSERALAVTDHVAGVQQSTRLGMELMAQDIKMAGYSMITPVGLCNTALVPLDNNPAGGLGAINDTGPDMIRVVVPSVVSTLQAAAVGPFNTVTLTAAGVTAAQTLGFAAGSTISIEGAVTGQVNGAPAAVLGLVTTVAAPATFPVGAPVYFLQCITYQVILPPDNNRVCGGTAPCLVRGVTDLTGGTCNVAAPSPCVPVADGVEDIQFAYACDGCNAAINGGTPDGIIDDQNASNTFDALDFITNNTWAGGTMIPPTIRLVQITIQARELRTTQKSGGQAVGIVSAPVTISDHNPTADAGYNAATYGTFSRRILSKTVQVRNIGLGT